MGYGRIAAHIWNFGNSDGVYIMHKLNLLSRFTVIIIFAVYTTIIFVYGFWDYSQNQNSLMENIDSELYKRAASLKYIIPDDLHDRATDKYAISKTEDMYLTEKLTKFVKETGLKYIYSIVKKEEKLFFVVADTTADPETPRGTFYFYFYEGADASFFKAFDQDIPTYKTISDQWGTVRTVMVPEKSPGGVKYLACADYDISYVDGVLQRNLLRSITTVLFFLTLSVPIIFLYKKRHSEYMASLEESEEKYRSIFENAVEGFFQSTPEGRFISVNPSFSRILGYLSPEELTSTITDIATQYYVSPEDRTQYQKLLLEDGFVNDYEWRVQRKDGSHIWVFGSTRAIFDKNGKVVRYEGNVSDITERKQAEEAQKASEERYRTLTEFLPIAIFETDHWGEVTFVNQSTCQMTGYDQSDFAEGIIIEKIIAPQDHDNFFKMFNQASQGIYGDGSEYKIQRKDGSMYNGYINTRATHHSSSPGLIGYIFDLTIIKEAEMALRKSEEKLTQSRKMESLGLLAGGVAHDLNNILSGIVSYPELILLNLPEDSQLRGPIGTMLESGKRAAAIVEDLLTVARGVAITKQPLNINEIANDIFHSPEFSKLKQLHPAVSVLTDLDTNLLNINGSQVHIRKALLNLVSNALESLEGSGVVSVSTINRYLDKPLKGYDDVCIGEYAVLAVTDNGSGISSTDLERIFEPFFTKKIMGNSGTGLGLTVVWNVLEDHQGYINVTSDEKGTSFELYFPVTGAEIAKWDISMPLSINDLRGNGEMILVVDDMENQREISCGMLKELGYKTESVSSGKDAVEYLKEHTIDLILLDMIMDPGINGCETYQRILKISPHQKAIIASGYAETDNVKAVQNLGAGRYLKKPLSIENLGLAVKKELNKKK